MITSRKEVWGRERLREMLSGLRGCDILAPHVRAVRSSASAQTGAMISMAATMLAGPSISWPTTALTATLSLSLSLSLVCRDADGKGDDGDGDTEDFDHL